MNHIKVDEQYRNIFEAAADGLIIVNRETGRVIEANSAFSAMHGYTHQELANLPMADLIRPHNPDSFGKTIHAAQSSGEFEAVETHVHKDGSPFLVEVRWAAFTYQDQPSIVGVVRDVSARVRAEQLLQQRVEAHRHEQATLLEISQTLASGLELKPGLILDQLRVLIEYTQAGLFELKDSTLVALAVRGPAQLVQAMPIHIRLHGPDGIEALFNDQHRNRIADVWSTDPEAAFWRTFLNDQSSLLLDGMRAWMWVPLKVKDRTIGVMSVAHAQPDYFTAHHADLALTMANQAAITMVNAELYERAQTLAKLQERQRLAQELHDAVNQSLFSAGLIAEVLPRLWEQNPEDGRRALEDLRRLTRGALAEMRGLLAELRPAVLTGTELGDLLRQLGNALTGRTNVPVKVRVVGQGSLPPDVQVAFYRLCQEALSNVTKHSMASQVQIHLQYAPNAVELHIQDDGRGFDPGATSSGHSGLSMMRERAEAIGAMLSIVSEPGHGVTITARWAEAPGTKSL
ncbi:MAG TPA: PAS domain S-box protein [Anaerolineae bacterium]